jgi:adenine-specific DNA-methyltransferase
LNAIFHDRRFSFPKSLYAVQDTLRFFVADKPSALIVDFFAGSGTTLHAVNLLNAEDGGHRRCIMVTNNEVSADEAKSLTERGFQPVTMNGRSSVLPAMSHGRALFVQLKDMT